MYVGKRTSLVANLLSDTETSKRPINYGSTYLISSFIAHNNKQWSLLLLDAIFNQNSDAIVHFLQHHFV